MTKLHQGESVSLWMDTVDVPAFPRLTENLETDVCVVGAGVAGLTTAYLLQKKGKKVCVLEDFEIGSGQSGRTTAHLATALDERYFKLEKYHGTPGIRLAAESHRAAVEQVDKIVSQEKIDCDLHRVDGYLFSGEKDPQTILYKELDAVHRAHMSDVHLVSRAPFEFFDTGPCLRFPQQIQIHPMKYLQGLARCIVAQKGQIYTHTHVQRAHGGEKAIVETKDGHSVRARSIVIATNTPINDLFAIHTKQAPYRTYVIGCLIPKGEVPAGLYWDTLDPFHYIRIQNAENSESDILIVGGEDHKTGQSSEPEVSYWNLEQWTRVRFPALQNVVYRWSGQIMKSIDGLAFLGHNPADRNNVYVITGDSGNGMTHATIGAMIISDQISNVPNPWEGLYDPSRVNLRASASFLRENANVLAQYGRWLTPKEKEGLKMINPGEGAVIRKGLRPIAVFKNRSGGFELHSATCPHLGCLVSWNSVEKSWDCPCHGSRFDCHGKVMEGPSASDLRPVEFQSEILEYV